MTSVDSRWFVAVITSFVVVTQAALCQERKSQPAVAGTAPQEAQKEGDAPSRDNVPRLAQRSDEIRVPGNIQLTRDVVYGQATTDDGATIELKMDTAFLKQSDGKPMPAIVYIHGGGWRGGSKEVGLPLSFGLAQGGYFAASINYRLSGQAKYPAAVQDCKAAIRFIRQNASELGVDPNRIGVWGHSAGGHLAALLGTSGNNTAFDPEGEKPAPSSAVQCVVDISGPIDLTRDSIDGAIAQWLGGTVDEHPDLAQQASPMTYIDSADPPVLIIHGTRDQLVSIRHAEMFHKGLKEQGVAVELLAVEGAGHGITDRESYRRAAQFFDEHLEGKAASAMRGRDRNDKQPAPDSGDDQDADDDID
ncbi:MAG: alpha/beta hydrolase [Phycisphaerales bacterium]|nr:alpha/beta hydrolase [Phycisphaerales bacterium]